MGAYRCPVEVSDTAFFYNAAKTVVKIARIMGNDDDAEYYSDLADRIRKVWREKFFDKETFTVKAIVRRRREQCFISGFTNRTNTRRL